MAGSAGDQIDQCGKRLSLALMSAASLTVLFLDTGVVHATGVQQSNAMMTEGGGGGDGGGWFSQSTQNPSAALVSLGAFLRYESSALHDCPWNGS